MKPRSAAITLLDLEPAPANFLQELLDGLRSTPKRIPCKFFYDARGSRLFDQICEMDEYYLTRSETALLQRIAPEIAALCGPGCLLVELGSGSSTKTRLLLDHLDSPAAYVPIDISRPHLLAAAETLARGYFPLEVLPVCADYSQPLSLPEPRLPAKRRAVFFPGSTIGNFEPGDARAFLTRVAQWCQPGDALILGADLQKAPSIIESAYNDSEGITAAFNLNLLARANRELGADFHLQAFRHQAIYDPARGRVEMRLLSLARQTVTLGSEKIHFAAGEPILTEYSHKYTPESLRPLLASAGWSLRRVWTSPPPSFAVIFAKRL